MMPAHTAAKEALIALAQSMVDFLPSYFLLLTPGPYLQLLIRFLKYAALKPDS